MKHNFSFVILLSMILCLTPVVSAEDLQQATVSGRVTDSETGMGLPGVTVLLKGTTVGTLSEVDGGYTLNVSNPANATLVFSFIGYATQEVAVAGRNTINIQLAPELLGLDEVVVIGYGTARRSDIVGSTSPVSTADVVKQPAPRIDQALQGRSPGIVIQNTSAAPDARFSIRIRGSNSLSGSNDPLIVVDGFVGGNLSTINPNEIESLEVLKDASSTAIYGSRGANGVILITTKRGAAGSKPVVEINSYAGIAQLAKKIDLLNAGQYAEAVNANRIENNKTPPFTADQIAYYKANGGTDWQDQVYRNAIQQSHQVSVSGGSPTSTYFLSANLVDNEGIIINSSMKRFSLRSNVETALTKRTKAGMSLFASKIDNHPAHTGGGQDNSPVQAALLWAPTEAVYLEGGGYTQPAGAYGPPAVYNPVALAVEPIRDYYSIIGELNTFLSYEIAKGLSARTIFGTTLNDYENNSYTNTRIRNGVGDNTASISTGRGWMMQSTTQLNYMNRIAGAHDINATLAFEYQRETSNSSSSGAGIFSSDALTYNNLALGS